MTISEMVNKYFDLMKFVGINVNPFIFLSAGFILGFILLFLFSSFDIVLGILLFVLCVDLSVGLPIFLADKKISAMEARLPDVLHHIGTTLKTGSTVEVALKEVSLVDYGPLSPSLRKMLDEMNKGKTFEQAFMDFASDSHSPLVEKIATIINAARRSGGSLLQTLTLIAEDIRSISRLNRERKTKTVMQFLFIVVASCLIAPFIFGILRSVLSILLTLSFSGGEGILKEFDLTFKLYLIIQASLSIIGAVMIREGKIAKSVLYIPVALLVSYVIYMLVSASFISLIGG